MLARCFLQLQAVFATIAARRALSITDPHILVVDDNQSILALLDRLLRQHAFKPRTVSSVTEAISIAEQHRVDAVILDLRLRSRGSTFLAGSVRSRHMSTRRS
jgi:DNA-binding response OmpR family regulator